MSYMLALIFIIAAIVSLGKIEFNQFIMLCAISVGYNIAGAIELLAQNKNKDIIKEDKKDE